MALPSPKEIECYFDRLWPLLRSITGEGVRRTHDILAELLPLRRMEIPTGTKVLDWTVPKEWILREAYVVTPDGQRILDVTENNLHLLNYSVPFRGRLSRAELDQNLHSLPEQPTAVPYVTSYYAPRWGFCIAQAERDALPDGDYEVVVDTELVDGAITLSDAILPGREPAEVLISTYTCHPSLANNELSGPLVAAFLYRHLAQLPERRLTYRFVFVPETIGTIAYLAQHGEALKQRLVGGYVVTCAGDAGAFTYKRSRRGHSLADRAAEHVLARDHPQAFRAIDFFPLGSDERQYCSPGFNLPVGSIMRTMYNTYPEYHTSLDNKDLLSFEAMVETIGLYAEVCKTLEMNRIYRNLSPHGEPNLGRRGLYPTLGGARTPARSVEALLWLLNMADGTNDLLAIAERSGIDLRLLDELAALCVEQNLLEVVDPAATSTNHKETP